MTQKTVLLIDDEQGFLEALADALKFEGHNVLTASSGEDALHVLANNHVDLATVDLMMPPGKSLETSTSSHETGLYLCEFIRKTYPSIQVFSLSVVSDQVIIRKVESLGVRFLRKGETPLRTVLNMIRSKLTGTAYSTKGRQDTPGLKGGRD